MSIAPRYPRPLAPGSRILVTAPSSGVPAALHPRLDAVVAHLRAQEFEVLEGECLRAQSLDQSAPADARAAELMRGLLGADISAVLPPWGGERAIELLPKLDWAALQCATPRWFGGFSDLSTLMVPLLLRAGWASFHGPNLMDVSATQIDPLTVDAHSVLVRTAGARFSQRQSAAYRGTHSDWAAYPNSAYILDEPTRWRALDASDAVRMHGRLLGGCLDTLMHLVGTPYGDVAGFVAGCGEEGVILFLENSSMPPTDLVRALSQLRYSGWLDGIAGLLMGRSNGPEGTGAALRYEDAVRESLAVLSCPVLIDVDIGHVPPQLTLVQGALAEVTWSAAAGGQVVQTLL